MSFFCLSEKSFIISTKNCRLLRKGVGQFLFNASLLGSKFKSKPIWCDLFKFDNSFEAEKSAPSVRKSENSDNGTTSFRQTHKQTDFVSVFGNNMRNETGQTWQESNTKHNFQSCSNPAAFLFAIALYRCWSLKCKQTFN